MSDEQAAAPATDFLLIDGREWTAAELAAWTEPLHVVGSLFLRGYAHPLPDGLTSVGGSLDLEGYAHPLPAALQKRAIR